MNPLRQVSPLVLVLSLWWCLPVAIQAVTAAAPPSAQAQESGRISGVAIDERGQPVTAATVCVEREISPGHRRDRTRQILNTTTTDAEGRFSFSKLPVTKLRRRAAQGWRDHSQHGGQVDRRHD
jgi:hypothetical protein